MIGAIAGDIIGLVYEYLPMKDYDFKLFHPHSNFTDDTVLTIAIAHAILEGKDYGLPSRRSGGDIPALATA